MNPSMTAGGADPDIDVLIEADQWTEALSDAETICRTAAITAIAHSGRLSPTQDASACILLADDARLRDLNHRFRGIDRPTNVLSFPAVEPDVLAAVGADGPPGELGDVAIAFETVAAEADRDDKRLADHLRHLVVHAILHLLGYDHGLEAEAATMEELEARILAKLGVDDPYAAPGGSLR